MKQKLYAYIDESGQDTKGAIFIVSVLVLENGREKIQNYLEIIERQSQKKNIKWHKAKFAFRQRYIKEIIKLEELTNTIFFEVFSDSKKYIELTSYTTAKAILKRAHEDYIVTIFIDGLRKQELETFKRGLKDLQIKTRKVRGIKKEENDVFIHLVDAICGLVRDAHEGEKWAQSLVQQFKEKQLLFEL
jgi:hypothetical protein